MDVDELHAELLSARVLAGYARRLAILLEDVLASHNQDEFHWPGGLFDQSYSLIEEYYKACRGEEI